MAKCNLCSREFKTEEALKQHKSNRHSVEHKHSGNKSSKKIWIWLGLILILFGLFYISGGNEEVSTKYDGFAQCLDEAGAEFYGAWWCHNCENQLNMFERSVNVPYNECSTSSRAQIASCNDLGIKSYPTWIFEDGSRLEGVQSFAILAEKTGCALPA
jgi:hypothetical protein